MFRFLKFLVYLGFIIFLVVLGYAYVGDLSPDKRTVETPVTIDVR